VALLVLVGTLGTLQYQWLGRVSEGEREQLRQSLDRRAREFADDFDREITRLYQGLQLSPIDPASAEPFAQKYDQWVAATSMPALAKSVYFVKATPPGFALYRYDPRARTLSATDWPEHLDVIRRRLTGTIEERPVLGAGPATKIIAFSSTSVVAEIPALVISLPISHDVMLPRINASNAGARIDHDFLLALRQSHNHVIIELDAAYLAAEVLPALITRHFSESGSVPYRVSILDPASKPIASRNVADGETIDPARADVTWPFFAIRPDSMRTAMLTWTAPVEPGGKGAAVARPQASMTSQVHAVTVGPVPAPDVAVGKGPVGGFMTGPIAMRTAGGHWRLLVQHSAGSLDAAVASARQRNLWLSFGILAVLATSVGLIVVNARRSERLAAQQMDFVAAVSHELRTPLAVIRSAAQNLSAGVVHEAGQAKRYGELIETEGRRLTEMVEQVLEYAGLEAHRRPPLAHLLDAGRVVSDTVSSCSALFEAEGFDVAVTVAPNLPAVAADEGALRRAITNLLTNALKHASSGRSVTVDVRGSSSTAAPGVEIAVTDRGPGIQAEDLGHIFEPFYRGRRATEQQIHGNGLGLSLVKRIAEAHGGRVTVKSAPGAGATFTLHLPAAPAQASVQPLERSAEASGSH
jgi:signal transduction histidine kinase